EEGFILDVLANYTTYNTMYRINKEIEDDPELQTIEAKRKIARFVELHDTNIAQRIEVIIEHFRQNVMKELGGQAKAMVVTASRQGAVKYKKAFEEYIKRKGYPQIHALVAFSGKVELENDERLYTEVGMNQMPEENVPKAFDTEGYNVMIVANKYQTGFDQKKLSAMYIMKSLKGVNAVQTLSRLNRICPPYDKKVFVLDFTNDYKGIKNAFAPFYTTTLLANDLTPTHIYDLMVEIDAYGVIDPLDIDKVNDLIFKKRKKSITAKEQASLQFSLNKSEREIKRYNKEEQIEIITKMRHFKRFYEYLIQVSSLEDIDLHKKYIFISYLLDSISISFGGGGFDLKGKIKATHFRQVLDEVHEKERMVAKPITKLPIATSFNLTEDKKQKLSEIIADINSRTGKNYDIDIAIKAAMQIRDIMLKSKELKISAKNNSEDDFEFSYFSNVEDALIEGLDQNQDFFSYLLDNEDAQKEVLGIFLPEIYKNLRAMGKLG
ncbi:MAG: type I restriction endonuclease subunit R, partial [Tissierellia bacterium]|nr:type I restriction endonuclease subunit R [Tissierellia bacterium]